MAIKIGGTTVIDDSRNIVNISGIGLRTDDAILPKYKYISGYGAALFNTLNDPNAFSTPEGDRFGESVATDGTYLIVGASGEGDASGTFVGKAYIYNLSTGALVWTLSNPNAFSTGVNDWFGFSVAISGTYAVVSAYLEDETGAADSGKVYIFNTSTGNLVYTVNNPNAYSTVAGDNFGSSVAISGNYLIVGAYQEDDAGGTSSGKAYIYNVTTGSLLYTLNDPNYYSTSSSDQFGRIVAASGNYALVSAHNESDMGSGLSAGSGKVYVYNITTGALLLALSNPNNYNTTTSDYFGWGIDVSGNYAVIGAYQEDDGSGTESGKAYVFDITTGAITWILDNPNAYSTSAGDLFGKTVAISSNYIAVSASSEDEALGSTSGKVYLFSMSSGALTDIIDNPNAYSTNPNDYFGSSLCISGSTLIVGSVTASTNVDTPGRVYMFNVGQASVRQQQIDYDAGYLSSGILIPSIPGQFKYTLNNPNAFSTSVDDYFGESVAISGNYAVVGASYEDDAGGIISGKAYIFNVTTGQLVWTLNNPNAYSTSAGDLFGCSISISGNYVIVGAYGEDDTSGSYSGKAYIFNVTTGNLVWALNNPNAYSTSVSDNFGSSVAISGNYAIVGANAEDDTGGTSSGKAYIFNVTTGQLVWTLNNPNAYSTSATDLFGISVAISGNYAIVGSSTATVNDFGKAYIFNVTTGQLVWTLDNPNAYSTGASDQFGNSVAISGNYAIVGARYEDDAGGTGSGKAYIFNVTTGQLVWTLNNPNAYSTSSDDQFGYSVAISGNYAIVSANWEDDAGGTFSGKAYIFNVTTGNLVWALNNPNAYSTSAGDNFGNSVAISGNYAIVGAWVEDDAGGTQSGKAYIFTVEGYQKQAIATSSKDLGYVQKSTGGALKWTLDNPNAYSTSLDDKFGYSVAISGNYAIVGAYQEDDAGGTSSGKAYVYNVTTGQLVWTLNNPNAYSTSGGDEFGRAVAISEKYIVIGANRDDYTTGVNFGGTVYVYSLENGSLLQTIVEPNRNSSQNVYFGYSVSVSGNYIIVGAPGSQNTGQVYIFDADVGRLRYTLTNPDSFISVGDNFGVSVAISGNYAIVGARYEDDVGADNSGKAYIFNITTGALVYTLNNPNAYSTSATDLFGFSVAISGNYAIVGAYGEDDAGGGDSGKAYIYNVTTGNLVWTLNNPNAYDTSSQDGFGTSVAIYGNYAIVGTPYEDYSLDGTASNSGKAYIFNVTTGQLVWTLNNPRAYSTDTDDNFGISVAISDNYTIVGAYNEDDASGTNSGKAYIFAINNTYGLTNVDKITLQNGYEIGVDNKLFQVSMPGGALVHTIDNPNAYGTSADDYFISGAISGNYAIFGAQGEADAGGTQSGKAYIFNVTTGQLVWTLNNPNAYGTSSQDGFGTSVAIYGNYAVVGAALEDDAGGLSSGKAYIFNVTTGQLVWTLNNPNAYSTSADDGFGYIISMSDKYVVFGVYTEDDAGGISSGKAYIFNVTTGQLIWTLNNPNEYSTSSGDQFGLSVAISGSWLAIIAPTEDDVTGLSEGRIYLYDINTGSLVRSITRFSMNQVVIKGNYIAVSTSVYSSGSVIVYDINTGNILQTFSNPNVYSSSISDDFGISIAVTDDYLIVGARYEDSPAATDHGYVYVFNIKTGALVHAIRNPEPTIGTSAGFGVSVSADKNYFVANSYGATNSGKAYVFTVKDLTNLDRLMQLV